MDIREQTAGERAAYARGLDDGARRTRETIAASLAKHAAEWRGRPPSDAAAIVATTLEGLAEALGGTAQTGPTPAEALAQDGAEDELEQARRGA